ncbi:MULTISPECIES: hypothetical protein [unclassified Streptomyces]|uniref:hypothetical protein n=1 Tax=unclassified Streptomyces TaxID=2593676 RepID=UPI002DDA2972|nr:hypothetical protein [Streptomyces sp. NBC_01257]WRZ67012.1 hypothetical protein OG408_25405 [Streptomyces sp. NBC_01257]WSU61021.1 hypothetical protein OG450_25665 [Streptomyces sp. NBC_01104]
MSGWQTAEKALRDHAVRDVLLPGYLDRDDDVPEFRPQPLVVWLRLDEGLLRFESVGQFDRLSTSVVDGIDWSGIDLFTDAEDEVIVASCGEQHFGDGRDRLHCTRLRVYRAPGAGPDVCTCLALDFEGGTTLFLDPTWTFGIRAGNAADEQRWLELYDEAGAALAADVVLRGE